MPQPQTSREDAERIITEFQKSGLSQNEYCRQNNVNVGTFRWWLKRKKELIAKKNENPGVPFVKVVPSIPAMKNPCRESELVIEFVSGTRLKWKGIEIPQAFHQLLSTLVNGAV